MELGEYIGRPAVYLSAALVTGPVLGGLAKVLSDGDFIEGARQVLESPQVGNLYLILAVFAAFHHSMWRRHLPNGINVIERVRSGR